jgi:hypothetical protein
VQEKPTGIPYTGIGRWCCNDRHSHREHACANQCFDSPDIANAVPLHGFSFILMTRASISFTFPQRIRISVADATSEATLLKLLLDCVNSMLITVLSCSRCL